ncbi:MAG: TetR/AcrR family transcriptional regulator [Treponema sp.]|nr:TetR/AcrR family transcriptional regulator [Treponema sp.]
MKQERKTCRRGSITKEIIKTSFLSLLKSISYPNITITDVCKNAAVSRSSFYLHFDGVHDVLDAILTDIFLQSCESPFSSCPHTKKANCEIVSICQFVRRHKEYHVLFTQEILTETILETFANCMIQACKKRSQIHHVFDFYFAGCFYILKKYLTASDATWEKIQSDIIKVTNETFNSVWSTDDERKKVSTL